MFPSHKRGSTTDTMGRRDRRNVLLCQASSDRPEGLSRPIVLRHAGFYLLMNNMAPDQQCWTHRDYCPSTSGRDGLPESSWANSAGPWNQVGVVNTPPR